MSDNFKTERNSRTDYEMILRVIAKLMTGDDLGQGGLHGFVDAAFWDSFRNDDELYDNLNGVIKGIMIGLDNLRQKIEVLDL